MKIKPNKTIVLFSLLLLPVIIFIFKPTPLWLDECALGYNIIIKSYSELLQPLDMLQVAPIGFLLATKFLATIFHYSDFGLRLTSILGYLCILFIIYKLYIKNLININSFFTISLFSTFIFYSFELKQYIFDVLSIFTFFYFIINIDKFKIQSIFIIIILSWFSNIGLIFSSLYFPLYLLNNKKTDYKNLIIKSLPIYVNLIIYYLLFIYNHPHSVGMKEYWASHFLPLNASAFKFLFNHLIEYVVYHSTKIISNKLLVLSMFIFLSIHILFIYQNRLKSLLFYTPIIIAIALSILKIYPFDSGRLTLYTITSTILISSRIQVKILERYILIATTFLLLVFNYNFISEHILKPKQNAREILLSNKYSDYNLILDGSVIKHYSFYSSQSKVQLKQLQFKTITHSNKLEDLIITIKKINPSEKIIILSAHRGYLLNKETNENSIKSMLHQFQINRIVDEYKKDSDKSLATLILK